MRWKGVAVAVAGLVLVVLGLYVVPWHRGGNVVSGMVGEMFGLRGPTLALWPSHAEACVLGACRDVGGASSFGAGTHWVTMAFALCVVGAAAWSALGDGAPASVRRGLGGLGLAALVLVVLRLLSIGGSVPAYEGSMGLGGVLTLVGVIIGLVGVASAGQAASFGDGRSNVPLRPSGAPPASPTPRATPSRSAADYQGLVDAATERSVGAVSSSHRQARPAPVARPGADAATANLRFVADELELRDEGLVVSYVRGAQAELVPWSRLRAVVVRRLPPDPPFDKVMLLDVVLDSGVPIRLLPSTRANYAALPEGQAPGSRENFRRLCKHLRQRAPRLEVEPPTAAFVDGAPDVPIFPAIKKFAEYDAGYVVRDARDGAPFRS
jgi:hypothetical protein